MNKWQIFAELVKLFGPLVIAKLKPNLSPVADHILDGINEAEQLPGATNSEKLQHVQNIGNAAAKALNATGKTNINVEDLDKNIDQAVTAVIKVANAVRPAPE